MRQPEFFDYTRRLDDLKESKPFLSRLKALIPWESFRNILEKIRVKEEGQSGRRPFDAVLMFKILVLQRLYDLSDEQTELEIKDRLTLMEFLDLDLGSAVPDRTTIWYFKQQLNALDLMEELFIKFEKYLGEQGYASRKGSMVDASLVEVRIQRNTRKENEEIKNGKIPDGWIPGEKDSEKTVAKKEHHFAQKDTDARWVEQNDKQSFGYKNHVRVDVAHKLVRDYEVTPASTHDSQKAGDLIEGMKKGDAFYADSAYQGETISQALEAKRIKNRVCRKAQRGHPLKKHDKKWNRRMVSRVRSRIEHVFGDMYRFGGDFIRTIGHFRAVFQIGLINLAYNFRRFVFLETLPATG